MASIVVVGPHPDDQELGMGGTIARLARQGHTVHLIDMTNGEPTPLGSVEIRAKESAGPTLSSSLFPSTPTPIMSPSRGSPKTRALTPS